MGCDIHGVFQVKGLNGSYWHTIGEIPSHRSYLLFGVLAGVRNYSGVDPISEPRGLPEGFIVNDEDYFIIESRFNVWMGDHSHSWLSIDELLQWEGWDQKIDSETTFRDASHSFQLWLKWAESEVEMWYKSEGRIVFGFDN